MSNTYFQFRQFVIHQEKTAMKVCTDACLFGAWIADLFRRHAIAAGTILDIGTGTGLLSLMAAQQTTAIIDAIEIDEQAAEQALQNMEASPWGDRMQVIRGDARLVHLGRKYDLVMSNPPFFDNDLKSPDQQRNLALHSSELSLAELFSVTRQHLGPEGKAAFLIPWHRKEECIRLAGQEQLYIEACLSVRQTPAHGYFRAMLLFGQEQQEPKNDSMYIRDKDGYSTGFTDLLKEYYDR